MDLTFENLPALVGVLIKKVEFIEERIKNSTEIQINDNMTVKEVADFLKVQCSTIYNKVHRNKIPHHKGEAGLWFSRKEIIEWMQPDKIDLHAKMLAKNKRH